MWIVKEGKSIECGYRPRIIVAARNQSQIFVGASDGTVTLISSDDLWPEASTPVRYLQTGLESVEALCELDGGLLVAGDRSARLACGGPYSQFVPVPGTPSRENDESRQIIWIGRLDDRHLIVGRRQKGARIVRCHGDDLRFCEGPRGFTCFLFRTIRVDTERWLFISQSGLLSWLTGAPDRGWSAKWIQGAWDEIERPAFVSDVAAVTPPDPQVCCREAYLATDVGVLHVSWNGSWRPRIQPVRLMGLHGLCTTVVHLAVGDEPDQYLWAADSAGYRHLFGSRKTASRDVPQWQRLCLHRGVHQVIKAVIVPQGRKFVVVQACRDDRIRRTVYEARSSSRCFPEMHHEAGGRPSTIEANTKADGENDWQPEARFANGIERIAETNSRELASFLANPEDVSKPWSILEPRLSNREYARTRQILKLWTHTLLGAIHRWVDPDRRETSYLGLIRWLRRLGDKMFQCLGNDVLHHLGEQPDCDQPVIDLFTSIEANIHYVRKWGVFGRRFAERRESLIYLCKLSARSNVRPVERLVYHGLIFYQRFDLEDQKPTEPAESERSFCEDLRVLRFGNHEIVAVSWRRGGVEIYERLAKRGEDLGFELEHRARLEGSLSEYSRQLILGVLEGEIYLLEAGSCVESATDPEASRERLRLHTLCGLSNGSFQTQRKEDLTAGESVYRLLELEEGLILAGLRGQSRQPALLLIRVIRTAEGWSMIKREVRQEIWENDPPSVEVPVFSLAKADAEGVEGPHLIFAGCRDGLVWEMRIPRTDKLEPFEDKPLYVEMNRCVHLGSPISALASTKNQLIAGTNDGTVMAWERKQEEENSNAAPFVPSWASCEGSPIRRLHVLEESVLDDEPQLVLAMTEDGHAVVLSNRTALADEPAGPTGPNLVRCPGHRLDRIDLQATCSASVLLELGRLPQVEDTPKRPSAEDTAEYAELQSDGHYANAYGRVARLAVATRDGRLRLLTLFYPRDTDCRRRKAKALRKDWNRLITSRSNGSGHRLLMPHHLRHADTVHATEPNLPRIMAMWILRDSKWLEDENWPAGSNLRHPKEQWFSRFHRPLVRLRLALNGKQENPWRFFDEALEQAHRAGDYEYFEDILFFGIKEAHERLLDEAESLEKNPDKEVYDFKEHKAFLDVLEKKSKAWIGQPDIDSRVHTVIAQSFPDGRILWKLFRKAGQLTERKEISDGLSWRMRIIRNLLHHRDSQVALEMLRSSNEAILLACVLLKQEKDPSKRELRVKPIEEYIATVWSYAERTAHDSQGGVPDGVAHEVLRAFVLAMFVCPSAILLWSTRLLQCGIRSALTRADEQIVYIGKLLGEELPDRARELHEINTDPERGDRISYFHKSLFDEIPDFDSQINGRFVRHFMPHQEIVKDLHELARQFTTSPGELTLSPLMEHLRSLRVSLPPERPLEDPETKRPEDRFIHSRAFWRNALDDLETLLGTIQEDSRGESIDLARPHIVLVSRSVADWCNRQLEELEKRKQTQRIFKPQYTLYKSSLRELERAAQPFRESAALQRNVVIHVLDHELLARLEEHLLELWEVAQALHPQVAWDHEKGVNGTRDPHDMATATRFAHYLLTRAKNAESIPRSLRTLRGLLETVPDGDEESEGGLVTFLKGFKKDHRWTLAAGAELVHFQISNRERHLLRLALREIAQNQIHHGSGKKPRMVIEQTGSGCPRIEITCRATRQCRNRLETLRARLETMQAMIPPLDDPYVASLGTGLFLANLAAARAGWLLRCTVTSRDFLIFDLRRFDSKKKEADS